MKTYNGFYDLLQAMPELPNAGWVFVNKNISIQSESAIREALFYIAESELEEIEFEKSKRTFVECPTLEDVISILDKRPEQPSAEDYLKGVLYYREYDDFQE